MIVIGGIDAYDYALKQERSSENCFNIASAKYSPILFPSQVLNQHLLPASSLPLLLLIAQPESDSKGTFLLLSSISGNWIALFKNSPFCT